MIKERYTNPNMVLPTLNLQASTDTTELRAVVMLIIQASLSQNHKLNLSIGSRNDHKPFDLGLISKQITKFDSVEYTEERFMGPKSGRSIESVRQVKKVIGKLAGFKLLNIERHGFSVIYKALHPTESMTDYALESVKETGVVLHINVLYKPQTFPEVLEIFSP